jgi:hypothetical protein
MSDDSLLGTDGLGTYVDYVARKFIPPDAITDGPLGANAKVDAREGAPEPASQKPVRVVYTHYVPPQWEAPDFDAAPWEDVGEDCIKFYETPTYVYNARVPEMSMVTLTHISYQWNLPLVLGDTFIVELLRNHDTLATWEDRVIRVTGDLGRRFVIASHDQPMPCEARFDRNDIIGARVTFKGQFPFGFPKSTLIPGLPRFRVLLNGWRSTITSNTDGQQKNARMPNSSDRIGMISEALELVKLRGGKF